MISRTSLPTAAGIAALVILFGCASAGPDLNGPEGPGLMAAYSGDWVLDPAASENLDEKMGSAVRSGGGAGGMAGGRSGGGRGGMPGGGGMGGMRPGGGMRGGMPGAGMDPEEMRRSMEAIRNLARVPAAVSLTLQPETVTFSQNAGDLLVLTLGGRTERVVLGEAALLCAAKWKKDGIEINWETEAGGGVKDRISVDQDGNLVIEREINLMVQSVRGTLVYNRASR